MGAPCSEVEGGAGLDSVAWIVRWTGLVPGCAILGHTLQVEVKKGSGSMQLLAWCAERRLRQSTPCR